MATHSRQRVRGEVDLHVVESGDPNGQPLVFLHGVMMSGRFFDRQLGAFPDHHVVVPDLRGHGDSEKVLSGHTVANYARDLHALLEAMAPSRRPILVGWSMGAMVAWEYLKAFGAASARGLVVVDQPPSDFAWPGWEFGALPLEALRDMVEAIQTDRRPVLEEFQTLMVHTPGAGQEWMVGEMEKLPPAVATSILCNQTFQDYRPLLPELHLPTLVCFGADDKLTSPRAGAYIAERMPTARLEVFEHSSHMPFYEEAEAFNRAVAAFARALA